MMALEATDIAHLIGEATVVRICHDLASPSGALTNGVELLGMTLGDSGGDDSFQNEAIGLLKNSTTALSARLEFYRAAFGNPNAKGLTAVGAKNVADKYVAQLGDTTRVFKLTQFPNGATDALSQDANWWRFALLMVLISAESMPYGGEISISVDQDMPVLQAAGRQAVLPDQFFQDLSQMGQIDPRTLGSVLLRYHAGRAEFIAIGESRDGAFDVRLVKNSA